MEEVTIELYAKELKKGDRFIDISKYAFTWLRYTVIDTCEGKFGIEVEAEDQYGYYHLFGPKRQIKLIGEEQDADAV